jgi:hypothetical protein
MSLLVLVVVALSIAIGIAFGTTKTTAGRTVGIAAVILSSEVLLLMAPFSFFLVGLYYMDKPYEKESVKYAMAAVVGWPLDFLGPKPKQGQAAPLALQLSYVVGSRCDLMRRTAA